MERKSVLAWSLPWSSGLGFSDDVLNAPFGDTGRIERFLGRELRRRE
ncbi:MAG: hypothetical protein ACE5PM_00355 [Candidatus Hydrothermarchaeales archaeon]